MEDLTSKSQHRARKDYVCSICYGIINKGSEYIRMTDYSGFRYVNEKRHIHCDALSGAAKGSRLNAEAYARGAVCIACERGANCAKFPSTCAKVLSALVPPSYAGAAKESAREYDYEDD